MVSPTHEAVLELFRRRPGLAVELLGASFPGASLTAARVEVADSNLTAPNPVERTADLVLLFSARSTGPPDWAVIVEVQLDVDAEKHRTWWSYLVGVHARHRCRTVLVVVSPTKRVAAWAAEPIPLGHPGVTLRPLVIGPADVPVVRDAHDAVLHPELAVLSAIVHGRSDAGEAIARAVFAAVQPLDEARATLYSDIVVVSLHAAARAVLEDLMANGTYQYQSDFAKRYFGQGRAEGEAHGRAEGEAHGRAMAIVAVLEARGVKVPQDARGRILACVDVLTLDGWLARAASATRIGEVLGE